MTVLSAPAESATVVNFVAKTPVVTRLYDAGIVMLDSETVIGIQEGSFNYWHQISLACSPSGADLTFTFTPDTVTETA